MIIYILAKMIFYYFILFLRNKSTLVLVFVQRFKMSWVNFLSVYQDQGLYSLEVMSLFFKKNDSSPGPPKYRRYIVEHQS